MIFRWIIILSLTAISVAGQITSAAYERAVATRARLQNLVLNVAGPVTWLPDSVRFWYRKSVPGGHEFVMVDAEALTRKPVFNHERLAAAVSQALGGKYTPVTLPFSTFTFAGGQRAIEFEAKDSNWRCDVQEYRCRKAVEAAGDAAGRPARPPEENSPAEYGNDVYDGMVTLSPQQGERRAGRQDGRPAQTTVTSPDGNWEARIRNFNVFVQAKGAKDAVPLSYDGSEGNYYTFQSLAWSFDSKRLVAYRVRPGYRRQVHYVESSPADQLQPKYSSRDYAKPGDTLDIASPVLFDVAAKKQVNIDNSLFPNPYSLSRPVWRKNRPAFTFEYNQRGHQVYRVIEVDGDTGQARALISEESKTFIDYRPLVPNPRDTGKKVRYDIDDGKEVIWMSERDGWAHLYLYDGLTGKMKNQITKGNWVVRAIDKVDEAKRQIWFQASGMYPGKDPYLIHNYRINFDGTGLTALTGEDANHMVAYSPDMQYFVDTWSRIDLPPVTQLRRTGDGKVMMELERAGAGPLTATGWRPPEMFTAPGRDGKTDIWGVICRPDNLDPSKKYPVVEAIYAGPQGSFVPHSFGPWSQPLTQFGFIVVQIDGMGTNNRSKAFHDVAWQNLKDAGFEDRILWLKAAAAKYPYFDLGRVGVFGNSAGGQNAMGALLFHPEFYKVAVSSSGCHDNRMDKIWWNEQWMGWPLGPHYAESSNVDNAYRLQGKLLLIVPEMDTNVDPSSTFQVVNALIKANKRFDMLYVPGANHGPGGVYGERLQFDFFVHNLLGLEPPTWQPEPEKTETAQ
jgi:dienelactone hydrolase